MKSREKNQQMLWLAVGLVGGLCLAYLWPHEHVFAGATDRDAKFAICTVDVGPGTPDAVFVLDFTTGRLQGALLNPQSQTFTNFWFANVAQDFSVGKTGKYAMIPGSGFLNAAVGNQGNGQAIATGVLYLAEMTSGKVGCYRFGYVNSPNPIPPTPLQPVDVFPFRDALAK